MKKHNRIKFIKKSELKCFGKELEIYIAMYSWMINRSYVSTRSTFGFCKLYYLITEGEYLTELNSPILYKFKPNNVNVFDYWFPLGKEFKEKRLEILSRIVKANESKTTLKIN